jgi:hypothetical protein
VGDRIGEYLVQIGALTQGQVDEVIKRKAAGDTRMFGAIAIELGYMTDDTAIKKFLESLKK